MTHDEFRERIGALLDGELEAEEAAIVERHLAGCDSCRAARDEILSLSAALRDLPRETMPSDLRADLMRRARDAGGDRRGASIFLQPWALASAASAALLVVVVAIAMRPGPPEGGATSIPASPAGAPTAMKDASDHPQGAVEAQEAGSEESASPTSAGEPLRKSGPTAAAHEESSRPAAAIGGVRQKTSAGAPPTDRGSEAEAAPSRTSAPAPRMRRSSGDEGTFLGRETRVDKPSGPGRYAMTMTRTGDGRLGLGPLVPLIASPASPARGEPQEADDDVRRLALNAPAGGLSAGTGASDEAREAVRYDGPPVTLVFLLRTNESGVVLSADPVGARLVPLPTMRAIAAMLVGCTLQPHRPDDPTLLALQVSVPEAP